MPCSATLNGIPRDCEANVGGIVEILLANYDDVTGVTLDSNGGKITAITMASNAKFKRFYFKRGQASFTSTPQFNDAGEYVGEDGTLNVAFGKMDTTKRVQMSAISTAELVSIHKDANGYYWYLGKDNPVLRNGGDAVTGANSTDRNQYGLQLHSTDNGLAYEVDADALEDIVG